MFQDSHLFPHFLLLFSLLQATTIIEQNERDEIVHTTTEFIRTVREKDVESNSVRENDVDRNFSQRTRYRQELR